MTAIKLDGDLVASELKQDLAARIAGLADRGIKPGLGTILVGDDGPSANYVAMKHRDSEQLGMASREIVLPATATQAEIDAAVDDFNADPSVDAYIIQYPFPGDLDYEAALIRVDSAAAQPLRRADQRQARRNRGPWPDDRSTSGQPDGTQARHGERGGHRCSHRCSRHQHLHQAGRHSDRSRGRTSHDQGRHG